MSDSNIGARKNHNIRNHLFVVYGVINDVLKKKKGCIDVQIYDLIKAFDNLWLEDTINDKYENTEKTLQNDKLALLYRASERNSVAVKTPVGLTNRIYMTNIVQQGGTWGPIKCSNSIDKVGKKFEKIRIIKAMISKGKLHFSPHTF